MPQRHRGPLPIPTADLLQLQGKLNVHGSALWSGQGTHVFVARVADDEPDLVNDLETIVTNAAPLDIKNAESALAIGRKAVHVLPLDPLRRLMQDRVDFDSRHAARLRQEIQSTQAVILFRGTDDPKRRLRLAIRIAQERVAEMDDDDLLDAAEALGDQLETGLPDVHCVYIISARDYVRLAPAEIIPELVTKWADPARREQLEQERLAEQMAANKERESAKAALQDELKQRFPANVAYAPVKRTAASSAVDFEVRASDISRKVDALEARTHKAAKYVEEVAPESRRAGASGKLAASGIPKPPSSTDLLATRLTSLGYEVRLRPKVPGHNLRLAAERNKAPRRVIAIDLPVLDQAGLRHAQAAAAELPVECIVLVAPRGSRKLARTLPRGMVWVQPKKLGTFSP